MEIKISLPPQALKQWNESLEQKLQFDKIYGKYACKEKNAML